jgi:hypothetical protein
MTKNGKWPKIFLSETYKRWEGEGAGKYIIYVLGKNKNKKNTEEKGPEFAKPGPLKVDELKESAA